MKEGKGRKKGRSMESHGHIIFMAGLLIVFLGVILSGMKINSTLLNSTLTVVLIVLGFLVGFINVTKRETVSFMLAAVVFLMLFPGFLGGMLEIFKLRQFDFIVSAFSSLVIYLSAFITPAALYVALASVFSIAKDEK